MVTKYIALNPEKETPKPQEKEAYPFPQVIYWFVRTGNYLPGSKRVFATQEEAVQYVKEIVDKKEDWVTTKYVMRSFEVIKINATALPEWANIFKIHEGLKPVSPPTKSELGLRKPKDKKFWKRRKDSKL